MSSHFRNLLSNPRFPSDIFINYNRSAVNMLGRQWAETLEPQGVTIALVHRTPFYSMLVLEILLIKVLYSTQLVPLRPI